MMIASSSLSNRTSLSLSSTFAKSTVAAATSSNGTTSRNVPTLFEHSAACASNSAPQSMTFASEFETT